MSELKPGCERIEIGGGIRRGKADVHDIEIVAIPSMFTQTDLFGAAVASFSNLDTRLKALEDLNALKRIKGGGKYKQFEVCRLEEFSIMPPSQPFCLDLFLVTPPSSWGVQFTLRTGPGSKENNFSQWMVTKKSSGGALPDHCFVEDGAVWDSREGCKIETPEEEDFFRLCGLEWVEPSKRVARWNR